MISECPLHRVYTLSPLLLSPSLCMGAKNANMSSYFDFPQPNKAPFYLFWRELLACFVQVKGVVGVQMGIMCS